MLELSEIEHRLGCYAAYLAGVLQMTSYGGAGETAR